MTDNKFLFILCGVALGFTIAFVMIDFENISRGFYKITIPMSYLLIGFLLVMLIGLGYSVFWVDKRTYERPPLTKKQEAETPVPQKQEREIVYAETTAQAEQPASKQYAMPIYEAEETNVKFAFSRNKKAEQDEEEIFILKQY